MAASQNHVEDVVASQIAKGGGVAVAAAEEVLIDAQHPGARAALALGCPQPQEVLEPALYGRAAHLFPLAQPAATAEVTLPDGTKRTLKPEGGREIVFGETGRQGIYRLRAGTNEVTFCVNVLDAAESNTKPVDELQFGKFNTVAATGMRRANVEIWRWIAAGGLAALMFEWWFYHRRTV